MTGGMVIRLAALRDEADRLRFEAWREPDESRRETLLQESLETYKALIALQRDLLGSGAETAAEPEPLRDGAMTVPVGVGKAPAGTLRQGA